MGPKFDDVEREMAERALVPEPPNLKAAGFAREEQKDKEVNLEELDVVTSEAGKNGVAPG